MRSSQINQLVLMAFLAAACGGAPPLVDQCRFACRHLFHDCLTGNACSQCSRRPEDTQGEAACEADCATRPASCSDQAAVYQCLSKVDCSNPNGDLLSACYAGEGCDTLFGSIPFPPEHSSGFVWLPGGGVWIELSSADAGSLSCAYENGPGSHPADVVLSIDSLGDVVTPGTFQVNSDDTNCQGVCKVCPNDAGFCVYIDVGYIPYPDEGNVGSPVSGSIELLAFDETHIAGTFVATEWLPDGGVVELAGHFDAPTCLGTPFVPRPASCDGVVALGGDAVFPGDLTLWLLALHIRLRSWRLKRARRRLSRLCVP